MKWNSCPIKASRLQSSFILQQQELQEEEEEEEERRNIRLRYATRL